MIKFFRKIRQGLLSENKLSKYLLYAIGEIVLVMIGILMALQINNWNEQRKLHSKVASIYTIVKSDLISDIISIDEVFATMSFKDSVLKRIAVGEMTLEDYQNCEECEFVLMGYPDITLKSRGLTLLDENSTIFDSQSDSLFIRINEFYSYYITEIDVDNEEIGKDHEDNWFYFKNNKSWFADYVNRNKNEEFVEYAHSSSDYLNRVSAWRTVYYEIYFGHLKDYKENAMVLIEDLDKRAK